MADVIMQMVITAVIMTWLWTQAVKVPAQVDQESPTEDETGNQQALKRKDSSEREIRDKKDKKEKGFKKYKIGRGIGNAPEIKALVIIMVSLMILSLGEQTSQRQKLMVALIDNEK